MLKEILDAFARKRAGVDDWLSSKRIAADPRLFYASTDLRNAGYKIAPVDTNIYPAGFNNLCKGFLREAQGLVKEYFSKNFPDAKRIGILPEEHTRNTYYLANLESLRETISNAGFEVQIMNPLNETESGEAAPDVIILNNDFSGGVPEYASRINTPMVPPFEAGWHTRRKSKHFKIFAKYAHELADVLEIDPWLLSARFAAVDAVDMSLAADRERLAETANTLLTTLKKDYHDRGLMQLPYLYIKDDAGTYGMGITTITDAQEILDFNKKRRADFKFGKNKKPISNLVLQEGLASTEEIRGLVAEPVAYSINNTTFGGFFRMHTEADTRTSLNRPGMQFTKLCFHEMTEYKNTFDPQCNLSHLEAFYFVMGSVAALAASKEVELIKNGTY